jgi:hypothetical protein
MIAAELPEDFEWILADVARDGGPPDGLERHHQGDKPRA